MRTVPEPVERVSAFLRAAGAEARLEEFRGGTPTAAAAAREIGCPLGQVVKSVVFECDGRTVVALVPGDRRADPRKVGLAAGSLTATVAGRTHVERATGFLPGAVAPFALRAVDQVLIERTLLAEQILWVGAGSERHMAALGPADLCRLARARAADLVEEL